MIFCFQYSWLLPSYVPFGGSSVLHTLDVCTNSYIHTFRMRNVAVNIRGMDSKMNKNKVTGILNKVIIEN